MTGARQTGVSEEAALRHAGFWIRFTSTSIDGALVLVGVLVVSQVCVGFGLYVPLELTAIVAAAAYSVVALRWKGRTLGKALCGVTVRSNSRDEVGLGQAIARETVGKLVSTLGLFLGFVWIAFSRKKRGWHDYLAGTVVVTDERAARRARVALASVLISAGLGAGAWARELAQTIRLVRSMAPPAGTAAAYAGRSASALFEVASIRDDERAKFAQWIDRHGQAPIEYAVAKAAEHQVVIFGEMHERRDELRFLNELIPTLHRRAGVQSVAMEACLAEDNATMEKLVTAPEFDRSLALEIARHQPWGLWGWKGYWDVLETVWRLNRSIPNDDEKVRVIGLDRRMDMPSVAMVGFEDNPARDCPPWEKLRILRVIPALPRVLARDAFMAAEVEREIINKGRRGIVWVGRNHSIIGCPQAGPMGAWSRMGFMLRQRYGEKIFQIRLHGMDLSAVFVDRAYNGAGPVMADFLESVMQLRNSVPVGFDVGPSPLAMLRDDGSFDFHLDRRLGFVDVAAGFVFLAPWRKLKTCDWLDSYISPRMFVKNRPFYQAFGRRAGVAIHSAADANDLFSRLDD